MVMFYHSCPTTKCHCFHNIRVPITDNEDGTSVTHTISPCPTCPPRHPTLSTDAPPLTKEQVDVGDHA